MKKKVQSEKRKGIVSADSINVQNNTVLSRNDVLGNQFWETSPQVLKTNDRISRVIERQTSIMYYAIVSDVCRGRSVRRR